MKKRVFIYILIILLLILGILFVLNNNKIVSTITLDINPSIEINLMKNNQVKNVIGLNDEAKIVISDDLKGKTLDYALESIINNLIDKGFIESNDTEVILYSKGEIETKEIEIKLEEKFNKHQMHANVIVVENVTEEDEKLAKEYNISPAKVSYINSIIDYSNEDDRIDIPISEQRERELLTENYANKSISELKEMKDTGKHCDIGYTLEGDWCYKEINRVEASSGEVCPNGYTEQNGKCYEETGILEKENTWVCGEDQVLNGTDCIYTEETDAIPVKFYCSKGETKTKLEMGLTSANAGDANDIVCVDLSKATHPVSPCEAHDGTEYTKSGGKCYWHKAPIIASGCPGKVKVNGFCWDDATGIYICPGYRDGKQYKSRDEYCEHSIKYIEPTPSEYECQKDFTLSGNKCIRKIITKAQKERYCQDGYTKTNEDKCINYNKTTSKVDGFVCNGDNMRLKDNICIVYEIIESKTY